jgi:hypothetical protein
MTRKEYLKISKEDFFNMYNFPKYKYYQLALEYFKDTFINMKLKRPDIEIHLHHRLDFLNKIGYEFWGWDGKTFIGIEPLYKDDHSTLHALQANKMREFAFTKEANKKRSISLKEYYKNNISVLKGKKLSEEHLNKRTKSQTGLKRSEETRKKMRENHSHYYLNNKFSDLHKKNISESLTGRKLSESHILNRSKIQKGLKRSEETRKKMRENQLEKLKNDNNYKNKLLKNFGDLSGRKWFNNTLINVLKKECPEGFIPGRFKKLNNNPILGVRN